MPKGLFILTAVAAFRSGPFEADATIWEGCILLEPSPSPGYTWLVRKVLFAGVTAGALALSACSWGSSYALGPTYRPVDVEHVQVMLGKPAEPGWKEIGLVYA